ncbi:hypothetical protein AAAK29_25820 [Mesorhizobium sp. CCNWLW179-1]|uniref:hypothetical protein n=1 Tax=unclassified Mesorhizobium TaxID=325217 RepID=UPI0030147AD5
MKSKVLVLAVSALAIAVLPINFTSTTIGLEWIAAYAKGGNDGENGGGKGGGGGKGATSEHGKSADARGRSKTSRGSQAVSQSIGSVFGAVFGKERSRVKGSTAKAFPTGAKSAKLASKAAKLAVLPANVALPEARPKNFHAKLAGLNSLKRNYHAYLNSKSPRMAAISAFVKASANFDLANAKVTAAAAALAEAKTSFAIAVETAAVTPYDDAISVYDNPTVESLASRLEDLNAATVAPEDVVSREAEVATVEGLLDSAAATAVSQAETSLSQAELASEAAAVGTDDEALRAALLDAANDNRVAAYGDNYVDDEMMDWAKDVLGVGDAYGKNR